MLRAAFQGERGAYSEEAARALLGEVETLACAQFAQVFQAVAEGRAEVGVVPVENSEAGTVSGNYALLQASHLHVVGEHELRVRHCLLALPGETLESIREVHSHPQALMQCEAFLSRRSYTAVAAYDTAGAAKELAERRPPATAAIASALAGRLYGLTCLAEGIETNPRNTTRFLAIASGPAPRRDPSKTSIVFGTANVAGALYRALGAFASRAINVTKLESSPSRDVPWEYFFYIDLDGHQELPEVRAALDELAMVSTFVRVLGSYPAAPR